MRSTAGLRHRLPGPGFAWLKGLVLLPLWLLTLIWTGLAVFMGVIAGGMAGSLFFTLLSLGLVPVFLLLTWGLTFWIRGRTLADTRGAAAGAGFHAHRLQRATVVDL